MMVLLFSAIFMMNGKPVPANNMHELGFSFLYPMLLAIIVYDGSAEFLLGNMLLGSFHPLQTFLMVLNQKEQ